MVDIVSKSKRSSMMSGIRGKNTRPELVVRRFLHRDGLRFRLHDRTLPGHPDIVLARYSAIVDVHGCFWHQHPGCRYAYMPASNRSFWSRKLRGNARRDVRNHNALTALGWRVFIVWECEVANVPYLKKLARKIRRAHE